MYLFETQLCFKYPIPITNPMSILSSIFQTVNKCSRVSFTGSVVVTTVVTRVRSYIYDL